MVWGAADEKWTLAGERHSMRGERTTKRGEMVWGAAEDKWTLARERETLNKWSEEGKERSCTQVNGVETTSQARSSWKMNSEASRARSHLSPA